MPLSTDPLDTALDPTTSDLLVPTRFLAGKEAVSQLLTIAFQLYKDEAFFDLDAGMPWLPGPGVEEDEALLGNPFDRPRWIAAATQVAAGVTGVGRVVTCDPVEDPSTREVRVRIEVETAFDDTPPEIVVVEVEAP